MMAHLDPYYYMLRMKVPGEKNYRYCAGTGKYAVPKLYTLPSAKSACTFKNKDVTYPWEIVRVNIKPVGIDDE